MIVRNSARAAVLILLAAVLSVAAEPSADQQQKKEQKGKADGPSAYLRLARNADETPEALEVAIVRFTPKQRKPDSPRVDLIGAVHIADKKYYQQINREMKKYDVVLYELVAPEGTRVPKGGTGRATHPLSMVQVFMKDTLDLSFQLDEVDYTPENFIHADMSPDQFAESMKKRGESFWAMFSRMMGYAMTHQPKSSGSSDAALLFALFSKDRSMALKRVMAEQFEDLEGQFAALEGPDGSTLIAERNKVALKVLREQIDAGKRRIAIFYGAGHLPDFEARLRSDFGMKPVKTRWLTAWDLRDPQKEEAKTQEPEKQQKEEPEKREPKKREHKKRELQKVESP